MNRFAALDIEDYDEPPDAVEQERELRENVVDARRLLGNNPFLESLYPLLGSQYVISRVPPHVWRCKDGRTLFVEKMEDTHLLNSARLLLRKKERGSLSRQVRFSLKVLMLEANRRGRLL